MVVTEQDQKDVEKREPVKVSFSMPQIVGGALAAATAAAIGSQLGVAGTILGAAVASVVGGVAGTLYSAGLDRTHRKVTEAIHRGYAEVREGADYDPDAIMHLDADGSDTAALGNAVRPGEDGPTTTIDQPDPIFRDEAGATRVGAGTASPASPDGRPAPQRRRRRVWVVMALTTVAIFLAALVVITLVERGLGHALDGGDGTTVSQVTRSSPSASATASPTSTVTVTATPTPSPTASDTPTPTPTPTESATLAPTTVVTTAAVPSAVASGTSEPVGGVESPAN